MSRSLGMAPPWCRCAGSLAQAVRCALTVATIQCLNRQRLPTTATKPTLDGLLRRLEAQAHVLVVAQAALARRPACRLHPPAVHTQLLLERLLGLCGMASTSGQRDAGQTSPATVDRSGVVLTSSVLCGTHGCDASLLRAAAQDSHSEQPACSACTAMCCIVPLMPSSATSRLAHAMHAPL